MTNVVVFGASGMLGAMVADVLARAGEIRVTATARAAGQVETLRTRLPEVGWQLVDAETVSAAALAEVLRGAAWAVNAIGVIKPYIHDDNAAEVERAARVNALFPHLLAKAAQQVDCRVLQIATDCVYSGQMGAYTEKDAHDPLDVYGKSKSMGEVYSPRVQHLRCSIIGPEPKAHVSLLDWFLGQPQGGAVNGFTNHQWNGVTTLHFARLCLGVIQGGLDLPHVTHVVPAGSISKHELLQSFAQAYGRPDLMINPTTAKTVIDRTLNTVNPNLNQQLWAQAGYAEPPSVPVMVAELARFDAREART